MDPDGSIRNFLGSSPLWLTSLAREIGDAGQDLVRLGIHYKQLSEAIEAAIHWLVPLGWAVTNLDVTAASDAVEKAKRGDSDGADQVLSAQWDGDGAWRTDRVCIRLEAMALLDGKCHTMFGERARLVRLAKRHHDEGRYEASIPILLAQMEGIVIDLAVGLQFFSKGRRRAELSDAEDINLIEACLPALQSLYSLDVQETQAVGALSRHGVLHGRELNYDTRSNSAKSWSLMDALVQWAQPRQRELAEQYETERQLRVAGSQDVDGLGRRVDDREFSTTRDWLRRVADALVFCQRQEGRFVDVLMPDNEAFNLFCDSVPAGHGMQICIGDDGKVAMVWRRTVSGWVLGLALLAGDPYCERWYFAAEHEPVGLPSDNDSGWQTAERPPVDWVSL